MTELNLFIKLFKRQRHEIKVDYIEKDKHYLLWVWNNDEQLTQFLFDNYGQFLYIVTDY